MTPLGKIALREMLIVKLDIADVQELQWDARSPNSSAARADAILAVVVPAIEAKDAKIEQLSGLMRGMARRVGEVRQSLRFADAHVPQWERIIAEHKAEIERLRAELDATVKPNLWFTPSDEFPLEAHERADRERPNIGHAFPTLEWRQEQLDESPFVPPAIAAFAEVRDRKADRFQQHYEAVARIVDGLSKTERDRLINGGWPESDEDERAICGQVHDSVPCTRPRVPETNGCWAHYGPEADDERTVRTKPDVIVNGPGTYPLPNGGSLTVRVAEGP